MPMTRAVSVLAGVLVAAMLLAPAAQAQGGSTIPYEAKLLRLAEVLGSIHYLRNVCGEESNFWRDQMQALLTAENPEPSRRARLVASFNRGYRTFDSVYTVCTEQALAAVDRYMTEGLDLTREINSRYGD
jgi:uncharacterized protein (TIGR02301 family)